jgi:NADPH-dependent F420 reductase
MPQSVALIGGTGQLGPGLALRFALAGVRVFIGSREAEKGAAAAAEIATHVAAAGGGAEVSGHANAEAAAHADIGVITVPHVGQAGLLPVLAGPLRGKVVVSTGVAMRFERGLGPMWDDDAPFGGAALEVAALLPDSRVTAGFHSVSSAILAEADRPLDQHVIVTGDDAEAKRVTMELAELLPGVRAVDGGALRYARHSEQLTVLLISINRIHRSHSGIIVTDLPDR